MRTAKLYRFWLLLFASPSFSSSSSWVSSKSQNSWSIHLVTMTRILSWTGSLIVTWRWLISIHQLLYVGYPGLLPRLWHLDEPRPHSPPGEGLLLGQAGLPDPLHRSCHAVQEEDLPGKCWRYEVSRVGMGSTVTTCCPSGCRRTSAIWCCPRLRRRRRRTPSSPSLASYWVSQPNHLFWHFLEQIVTTLWYQLYSDIILMLMTQCCF